jgi:curved DNA-binding protein CbpA
MESFDLYEELELTKTAKPEEIKQSYRKLALKWHPDKNKGNEEQATTKFQKISEAYTILSDPQKKERYDKYGTINEEDFDFPDFMSHFDFQDIFGGLFGDLTFNLNFGGFSAYSGSQRPRGRGKGKQPTKAQMRREQKEAEKLMKEFTSFGFGDAPSTKKKDEKKDAGSDDDWDTEEEYSGDENDNKGKNDEDNDDDFEDVDSSDEESNKKNGKDDDIFDGQTVFFFPMFMDEKTTEVGNKLKCKFDNKVFKTDDDLFEHFNDHHKKEFKAWLKNKM